jgi:hypothetical protein
VDAHWAALLLLLRLGLAGLLLLGLLLLPGGVGLLLGRGGRGLRLAPLLEVRLSLGLARGGVDGARRTEGRRGRGSSVGRSRSRSGSAGEEVQALAASRLLGSSGAGRYPRTARPLWG